MINLAQSEASSGTQVVCYTSFSTWLLWEAVCNSATLRGNVLACGQFVPQLPGGPAHTHPCPLGPLAGPASYTVKCFSALWPVMMMCLHDGLLPPQMALCVQVSAVVKRGKGYVRDLATWKGISNWASGQPGAVWWGCGRQPASHSLLPPGNVW